VESRSNLNRNGRPWRKEVVKRTIFPNFPARRKTASAIHGEERHSTDRKAGRRKKKTIREFERSAKNIFNRSFVYVLLTGIALGHFVGIGLSNFLPPLLLPVSPPLTFMS